MFVEHYHFIFLSIFYILQVVKTTNHVLLLILLKNRFLCFCSFYFLYFTCYNINNRITEFAGTVKILNNSCSKRKTISMDPSVKIEMPALLDCLRKDIYALVSKLQLPQEQQVQIGQLIEQIRLEENKYQEDIKKLFQTNNATYESNLNILRQKCSKLEEKVKECESKEIRRAAEQELDDYGICLMYLFLFIVNERLKKSITTSLHHDEVQEISTVIQSMRKIHDDLVNLSMETRLSLEFEKKENDSMFSQVSSSLTTIVEKYQQLNALYVKECERRRKVLFLTFYSNRFSMNYKI